MSANTQAESVIKNIIKEVAKVCFSMDYKDPETLAAFMIICRENFQALQCCTQLYCEVRSREEYTSVAECFIGLETSLKEKGREIVGITGVVYKYMRVLNHLVKAVVLDPDNEFNVERPLTKNDVQRLIQTCVEHLSESNSPAMDTVKMQIHFEMNYSLKEQYLTQHAHVLESRVLPIFKDVADSRARNRDELEALYRKIVCYAILRSGLGLPTQMPVLRAVNAALQSVFPQTELGVLMSMSKEDKKKQLEELSDIVTGIRLFNWACDKGSEGIEDLPKYLKGLFDDTVQTLDRELSQALKLAFEFTGVILKIIESPHPCPIKPSMLVMKQCLINCRQYESFLKVLMLDVTEYSDYLHDLNQELNGTLEKLKDTVRAKAAVPTSQVYPLFTKVASIWAAFQSEVVYLTILRRLLDSLSMFTQNAMKVSETPEFQGLKQDSNILTDDQRKAEISSRDGCVDTKQSHHSSFLFPETTKNFDTLPLEFQGFCGYSFTVYDRLLLPAQPSIGVLCHKGKYYAFSSKKAAVEFADHADKLLADAVAKSKKSPEVIQLLNMHTQFQSMARDRAPSRNMMEMPVIKSEAGTQTDVHFMESNIVKSYEWNEWELRRQALKLADLRQKLTNATQTDLSHFRSEKESQVYPLRSIDTQTKRDKSSRVPKPSTYIGGLRGIGSSTQKIDISISDKDIELQ